MRPARGSWLHEGMSEQAEPRPSGGYRRYRLVVDAVVVVAASALLAALGFGGSWRSFSVVSGDIAPWAPMLTAIPAAVFMLTKRRAPWLSLIGATIVFAIDLLTFGGIGPLLVLLDVLWLAAYQASARGRRGLLWGIGIASAALAGWAILLGETDLPLALVVGAQFGVIFATDYWWAVAMAQANELTELHRQRADDAAAAAERDRAAAVRHEREVMARELHDVVAGHVLAMAIRAEAALSTPPDADADRAALRAIRDAGIDAHAALRSMISVLRRGDGDALSTPSLADLPGILADARRAGLDVAFTSSAVVPPPAAVEQAIVRVVREALANCARHANGAAVAVALDDGVDGVRVRVVSHGGAPAVSGYASTGWGLSMLRERVTALGGEFRAGPTDRGWVVEAIVPREVVAA